MSAYTTIDVKRSQAKERLIGWITSGVQDDKLQRLMDIYLEDSLYNCCIVDDDFEEWAIPRPPER